MNPVSIPNCKLFKGLSQEEIYRILECLSAKKRSYEKGDSIFHIGDQISSIGLVVSGWIHIIKEDYWGNKQILNAVKSGELFGESYAFIKNQPLMVQVEAAEKTEILFFNSSRILNTCSSSCIFHSNLIYNLLSILAEKNFLLTQKMDHMGQKKTRDKILSYLSFESKRQNSKTFQISFNRQQLADYLSVERSALSAELSKMQKEKILCFRKNNFTLLQETESFGP